MSLDISCYDNKQLEELESLLIVIRDEHFHPHST